MGTKPLSLFIVPPLTRTTNPRSLRVLRVRGEKEDLRGTTARIAARMLGRDLDVPLGPSESDAPPVGFIPGIDLVTEGVITLNGALAILSGAKGPHTQAGPRACGINGSEKLAAELERAREMVMDWRRRGPKHRSPFIPPGAHGERRGRETSHRNIV
jgi:hypothetical protein